MSEHACNPSSRGSGRYRRVPGTCWPAQRQMLSQKTELENYREGHLGSTSDLCSFSVSFFLYLCVSHTLSISVYLYVCLCIYLSIYPLSLTQHTHTHMQTSTHTYFIHTRKRILKIIAIHLQ